MAKKTSRSVGFRFSHIAQDGEAGLTICVTPPSMTFNTSKSAIRFVKVEVYKGDRKLKYQDEFMCSSLASSSTVTDGLTWGFQLISGTFNYRLSYSAGNDIGLSIPFVVTVDGVDYPASICVQTVVDGAPGLPGLTYKPMRIQNWDDIARGEWLYAGTGDDDPWTDVFFTSGATPVYYQVLQNFKKSLASIPVLLSSKKIRQSADFRFISTDLFLAKESFIKNLVVTKLMTSAVSGERVIIDPELKSMRIFDSSGKLVATYGAAKRTVADVIPPSLSSETNSSSNTQMGFGTINTQGTVTKTKTIAEKTVQGDGMLQVTVPSYSIAMTVNEANEGQGGVPRTSTHLYAYLYVNGVVVDSLDYGSVTADQASKSYDTVAGRMSASLKTGDKYKVEVNLHCSIGGGEYYDDDGTMHDSSGGSVTATAGGSMTAGYVASLYRAEYFGNGFMFATNSENYFYVLFEDNVLKAKLVSGGTTIFSTDSSTT